MNQIKCQICGLMVDGDKLFRSKMNENEYVVGHQECIQKKLIEKGLNESAESSPTKTGLLFE